MGIERRRSPRLSWPIDMFISTEDSWRPVGTVDVSSHGARFRGRDLPRLGTRVCVALRVPCHLLRLTAAVVWTDQRQLAAVEFDPLTSCQQRLLNTALIDGESARRGPAARGAVLLMIEDAKAQAELGHEIGACGYRPIARATPLDVVHSLGGSVAGVEGLPLRAAVVSSRLANRGGLDVLKFLAEECPRVLRALLADELGRARAGPLERAVEYVLFRPDGFAVLARLLADRDGLGVV